MYKRIIIKLSGEALANDTGFGIDQKKMNEVVRQLKVVHDKGVEVGIIIGGGNFWRGRQADPAMNKATADHMGMLATVMTALAITEVAEPFILRKAIRHLEKGRIVIFACGTGHPYFSTDTGAALRCAEIGGEALLLAKNVDGVYDSDPKINKNAVKFDKLSYMDVIKKELKAMDVTAITLCMDNKIPVITFALNERDSIIRVVDGEKIGTYIGD